MITITGVPEHFNEPILMALKDQNLFNWKVADGGTGLMKQWLEEGKADMAIMLFEGATMAIQNGLDASIISPYVTSPLLWGMHVGWNTNIQSIDDLKELPLLVSRKGSGSHLMPFVLALQEKWEDYNPKLNLINNLSGAIDAFKENPNQLFFWEQYTTQPYVDQGLMKIVDTFPTPWPAFVVVVNNKTLDLHKEEVAQLISIIKQKAIQVKSGAELQRMAEAYQLEHSELEQWLSRTAWFEDCNLHEHSLHIIESLSKSKLTKASTEIHWIKTV